MMQNLPCAIYTRKSSEEGLEQEFNSLDAQREACEAFILSQKALGWKPAKKSYDDGGYSGGNLQRPSLAQLLNDIKAGLVRIVVVYKVDRLTRSLADFAKLVEMFDTYGVSFVSVTQQFNTTTSMGRLTLNVLLSFAQFEREVTGERIRDKIEASKKKGMWMGGNTPLGYVAQNRTLQIDDIHADRVREIFRLYLKLGSVPALKAEVDRRGWVSPTRTSRRNKPCGGRPFSAGNLRILLQNPVYRGQIAHKGKVYPGQHPAIIDETLWQAVQERLSETLHQHKIRCSSLSPSLLAGLVFDAEGNRFGTDHARKKVRQYRYYVCHRHQSGSGHQCDRIPATQLEKVVLDALVEFLKDGNGLLPMIGQVSAEEMLVHMNRAKELIQQLAGENISSRIEALLNLVERVTIHQDHIDLSVRWVGPAASTDGKPKNVQTTVIEIPVTLRRSGIALRLILSSQGKDKLLMPDPTLGALIAKAQDWFSRLASGLYDGVQAIATEEKVSGSYVTRVIYLAFLAPDLAIRFLQGEHPVELNAKKLLSLVPLPERWEDQRQLLGMAA
jgi:site-specific DNA recombinase